MGKSSRLRKERKHVELANREAAKGYSSQGKAKDNKISMSTKGDRISKLGEQNQVLITKTESLKEEMKDNSKEAEKHLRKDIDGLQQQLNNKEDSDGLQPQLNDTEDSDGLEPQLNDKEDSDGLQPQLNNKEDSDGLQQQLNNKEDSDGLQPQLNNTEDSDSAWQYKVTENSYHEQNEMLQKEVDSARCLFEMQNQRIGDFLVENARLEKQLEEKEEQRTKFESLYGDFAKKYRELEEKHLDLLKENGEQEKTILELRRENASLGKETSFFLHTLNEETKRNREISAKCLESDERVLYLESQSLELNTELASAKSAYKEVAFQLNKIKEDMNKLSNDSRGMEEEKDNLHQNLMLQLSINKELEENLQSMKSSVEELKDSGSKGEQQIAMLQRQLLNVAMEKDGRIFDLQCELSAMVIQLADLQDKLSSAVEEKMLLEGKNIEIERRKRASEEEQVHLKGRIRELERDLEFVTKDLESCRAMAVEKECQLADSQYQISNLAHAKKCLQEENNSLRTELNKYKCTMVSEQVDQISDGIRELENSFESVEDVEPKDIQLRHFMVERQHLQAHVQEDGITKNGHVNPKPNSAHEIGKPKDGQGNGKPSKEIGKPKDGQGNGKPSKEIGKPKDGQGNGKPSNVHEAQRPNRGRGKQKSKK